MKDFLRLLSYGVITIIGALLAGSLPGLYPDPQDSLYFNGGKYVQTIGNVIHDLSHPSHLTYTLHLHEHPLFPMIFTYWRYSFIIFFCAFCLALLLATCLSFVTVILPKTLIKGIRGLLFFMESIPDVLIVILIQVFEISIFLHTQVKLFDIMSYSHPLYVLPIITLAILPTIMLYRMLVLEIEEETTKDYVEFAKSKGLSQTRILFLHIFRNTLLKTVTHARTIVFFMVSNLLIVEYVYKCFGLLSFLQGLDIFATHTPDVLTFSILMLMIPMALFLFMFQLLAKKLAGGHGGG